MAGKRGTRVTVLVEDASLERFARRTLETLGYNAREIRTVPGYPKEGGGSGKKWVSSTYPQEVRTIRQKAGSQHVALLVGTDADEMTVAARSEILAKALLEAGLDPRGSDEAIAHWIPRWSIETWGLALTGCRADEETKYKNTSQAKDIDWKAAADTFVADFRSYIREEPLDCLPSLRHAYGETKRI